MDSKDRIVSTEYTSDDREESSLRPRRFDEYIGQEKAKENLSVFIKAAKQRGESLDHVLLYGPPGLGKTTLAAIIAAEMGVNFRITSGPAIEKAADLAGLLTSLEENDVLFIDEIHRLNRSVEEILYPAMEDFGFDIIMGKGPGARSIRLDLKHFTLVGATTRAGLLSAPLRDRFGIINRLEMYNISELSKIIGRAAGILHTKIDEEGMKEIAMRSRGTPRIANRLLRRVRDFAQITADSVITGEIAKYALDAMEVDSLGLDNVDRTLLETIIYKFSGGPVGLETLSSATGEDPVTIEEVYEPYLIQLGFINKTPRGRMITELGLKHLNASLPGSGSDTDDDGRLYLFDK